MMHLTLWHHMPFDTFSNTGSLNGLITHAMIMINTFSSHDHGQLPLFNTFHAGDHDDAVSLVETCNS